ncbi:unnamed protein product [Paramecium pentaurelia]|uniref:Uncharacterized protein n=1 Tax=Paramecium pentaurelia TaxID=43138 RepID=A0A8S1SL94_9CILI|nr:unnamed protein product [Paramecium pentaurelia]
MVRDWISLMELFQKLIGHLDPRDCLLVNNNDNLIISCSHDCTINFWIKQKQWFCQHKISDHQDQIYSLSLNEQQNKLISYSKIHKFQLQNNLHRINNGMLHKRQKWISLDIGYVLLMITFSYSNHNIMNKCVCMKWIVIAISI